MFTKIASSTIPNYIAYRNTRTGSFFISDLCEVFMDQGHNTTLTDMLTKVNDKVINHDPEYQSAPEVIIVMSKKFMFQRTRESIAKALELRLRNDHFTHLLERFIHSYAI